MKKRCEICKKEISRRLFIKAKIVCRDCFNEIWRKQREQKRKLKKKSLILSFLFFLFLPFAFSLIIEPETQEVELFTDVSKNIFVNLSNTLNETIYFTTLTSNNSDIIFLDNNLTLGIGETRDVRIIVDTSLPYEKTENIKVIFYKKTGVLNQPVNAQVNITAQEYLPQNLEIFSGSTITFKNSDTIKHSVTSTLFDNDLNSGDSFSFTFNTVGIFEYYDKFTAYTGKIIVKDILSQEYVHNPLLDESFAITIKSRLIETSLNVEAIEKSSFNISYNRQEDAVLSVENLGNKTANIVKLRADPLWIVFGGDEFYIEVGKKKYVPYTIIPMITEVEQTNKNYTITIFAQGYNTLETNTSINVFIPYSSEVSINQTAMMFFNRTFDTDFMIAFHNLYCQALPESHFCKPQEIEKIVYKSAPIPYNYTQEDIHNYNRRVIEMMAQMERFFTATQAEINKIKEASTSASQNAIEAKTVVDELLTKTNEAEKKERTRMWILGILIILSLLVVFGLIFGKKFYEDFKLKESFKT